MKYMFHRALKFDQDLSDWDLRNLRKAPSMFSGAVAFNRALDSWNTSRLENVISMFAGATLFNGAIGGWDTGRATDAGVCRGPAHSRHRQT